MACESLRIRWDALGNNLNPQTKGVSKLVPTNYGYDDEDYENNPCNCGVQNCCGYILGPQYWDRIKQPAPQ